MSKELAEVIVENGIVYRLGEHDLYYPDLRLSEGTHYNIGKYGIMRWEYLKTNQRREYLRLLLDGKLNEYLHEIDEECHARVELICILHNNRSNLRHNCRNTKEKYKL